MARREAGLSKHEGAHGAEVSDGTVGLARARSGAWAGRGWCEALELSGAWTGATATTPRTGADGVLARAIGLVIEESVSAARGKFLREEDWLANGRRLRAVGFVCPERS